MVPLGRRKRAASNNERLRNGGKEKRREAASPGPSTLRAQQRDFPRAQRKLGLSDSASDSVSNTDFSNHSTPNISPLSSPINSPRLLRVGESAFVFTSLPSSPASSRSPMMTLSSPSLPSRERTHLQLPSVAGGRSQDSLEALLSPGRTAGGRLERLFSKFKSSTVAKRVGRRSPGVLRSQSGDHLDKLGHGMELSDEAVPHGATTSMLPVPSSTFSLTFDTVTSNDHLFEEHVPGRTLQRNISSVAHALALPSIIAAYGRRASASLEPNLLPSPSPTLPTPGLGAMSATSTSLAFESMFGELAIKVVFHKATLPERQDISLLRVNERKLDFLLVVHQLEVMHQFRSRGVALELWYVDHDGDELRITDTPGLIYACEDWRAQLQSGLTSTTTKKGVCRSMRLYINEAG